MSRHEVSATVDDLECEGTVVFEGQTWTDPGGIWIDDLKVHDPELDEDLDFEGLGPKTREKIEEALIDAARDERR